ncbi:transaldolase [Methylobacterium sp. NEAU K]|uniref:transaldolase n=1 Tax=Methylobacterium sp. NEAU K TaxID=3064946 RepID=UPI0027374EF9|nr:transaldolase [Methylobacterium sp. NEAU K]MDP4006226.1 transaldolase [Methylobacterium sp. NEAU K]
MTSLLDQLRTMTVVVADTGDIGAIEKLKPVDCTTNPSLLLKAAGTEGLAHIVDEAVSWGRAQGGGTEDVVQAVADRLAVSVGVALTKLVPGRVSTEVDANLSFDTERTLEKARAIIGAYDARGVPRERVLIKIASTWEGIQAARVLQREGVDCNLTLLFSLVQAMACADAGVFLISPFVGRITDWYAKAEGKTYTGADDPGVQSVRAIYAAYKARGIKTVVMGASFRNIGQIQALAGCDRLTIAPKLLEELAATQGTLTRALSPEAYGEPPEVPATDALSFRWELNESAMATEKLAEGIRQFGSDLRALHGLIRARLARV